MTNRLALTLALVPLAACRCGTPITGISENLTCAWWDAGSIPVEQVELSDYDGGAIKLAAIGEATVSIEGITIYDDGGGFSLDDAGIQTGGFIPAGQSAIVALRFQPQQPGPDIAYVKIVTDNGPCTATLIGDGIDECAAINLDGGCDAGINVCAGTCAKGACQWPSGNMCADGTQCITSGSCNGAGQCTGPSACLPTGVCDGGTYSGQIATNPDGTGTCNPSNSPYVPGQCLFNTRTVECDCGCGITPAGNTGCLYSWVLDATSPDAGHGVGFGSVWASQAGDVWASSSKGAPQGNTIGQAFFERVGGTWARKATLALGSNPLSGAGGTIALTGDQSGDVYAANACSFPDSNSECGDAGVWKWSGGTAIVEPLAPPSFSDSCGNTSDFGMTYPVLLGSTAAILNSDDCGPELMTESGNQFVISRGTQIQVHCSALASLWGTSTSDYFVAWGCSPSGSGGIWHYTGTALGATPDFAFGGTDYAEAMAGTSNSDIWAVGTQRWHYDGTSWTVGGTPPGGNPDESLWSVGDGTYFATGNYSGIYYYANNTWNLECLAPGVSPSPYAAQVAGDSNNNYYAATAAGIFKRLPDAGP